jgi:hypothetical protein
MKRGKIAREAFADEEAKENKRSFRAHDRKEQYSKDKPGIRPFKK